MEVVWQSVLLLHSTQQNMGSVTSMFIPYFLFLIWRLGNRNISDSVEAAEE